MKKLYLLILFFIICNSLMSQNIIIQQDNKILELIELHQKANLRINYLDGYRVQIFFDSGANSHKNANRTKTNFASKYPEVPVYLIFKEPNFRVRVGDFRTRHEARGFLVKIIAEYPNAFVIKDQINFPALENKKPEEIKE